MPDKNTNTNTNYKIQNSNAKYKTPKLCIIVWGSRGDTADHYVDEGFPLMTILYTNHLYIPAHSKHAHQQYIFHFSEFYILGDYFQSSNFELQSMYRKVNPGYVGCI